MPTSAKNEKAKRKYFRWLQGAQGFSKATIASIQKAIWLYEDYSKFSDYATFSQKKAIGFKEWLENRKHRNLPLSVTTQYNYLRHLNNFFTWLSGQPGYKSRISLDNVSYLCLEKKKVREALSPKRVDFPSLNYIIELANSIEIKTEIDKRDRALIAFLLLSGMRDKAICTLPMGCFDCENLEIDQNPGSGVDTKFGKPNVSYIFRFDDNLLRYILEWANYLKETKLFGEADPLFPKNKVVQAEDGLTFTSIEVEPSFWKSTNSIRKILKGRAEAAGLKYYHPHTFRHAAAYLALKYCHTGEQLKAISQNFSHENLGTTMMSYGNLDSFRMGEVIRDMRFSPKEQESEESMRVEIEKILKKFTK
jgi:integrase